MKLIKYLILVTCIGLLGSCAATIPMELSNAREAYQHASAGPAAQLAPAELHKAKVALDQAETSFTKDPKSYQTKDLAYVAWRKAIMAEALATIASDKGSAVQAKKEYETTQGEIMKQGKEDLATTTAAAAAAATESTAQLTAEQQARIDAEKRAADAEAELAKVAVVKEEPRGLVITLSGSVIFASNHATLLPAAQSRLNQVAETLMSTSKDRKLIVEGHTDSQGSASYNMDLSQRRAESVRSYLISRGYPAELIEARGIGKTRPIADNKSPEGRANNRRVEIIVEREAKQ
jgi:outer membrane protein OmpA-like peptidoglycan-associated protein